MSYIDRDISLQVCVCVCVWGAKCVKIVGKLGIYISRLRYLLRACYPKKTGNDCMLPPTSHGLGYEGLWPHMSVALYPRLREEEEKVYSHF